MALGVESEFVGQELKNAGIYGAIISVLLSTIGGLILYIRSQHKMAAKVYGYRLAERDDYNKALSESKAAILNQADAARERNKVLEEIARTISASSAQATTLNALLELQFDVIKEDHARESVIINSLAETVRNLASSAATIQAGVNALPPMFKDLQHELHRDLQSYIETMVSNNSRRTW